MNDPAITFLHHGMGNHEAVLTNAASGNGFSYISHGGQVFKAADGYGEYFGMNVQLTDSIGIYYDREFGFAWCAVQSGGTTLDVLAYFSR